jgi:DNA-binding IclR family transcriptional regulator
MAAECGLTIATAHRLLATLETLGAVIHTRPGEYRIGLELVELAGHATRDTLLVAAAEPVMRAITRGLGHTAHIGVLDEECMVSYIAKAGRAHEDVPTRIGSQLEAYCSGLGKVLLAAMPQQVQDNYIADGPFVALTRNTITQPEALQQELELVARQGYAVDDGEIFDHLRCIAVPIHGRHGQIIAAISTSGHASKLKRSDVPEVARQLQGYAAQISTKLYPLAPLPRARQH